MVLAAFGVGCRPQRLIQTTETATHSASVSALLPDSLPAHLELATPDRAAVLVIRRDTLTQRVEVRCHTQPLQATVRQQRVEPAPQPPDDNRHDRWFGLLLAVVAGLVGGLLLRR